MKNKNQANRKVVVDICDDNQQLCYKSMASGIRDAEKKEHRISKAQSALSWKKRGELDCFKIKTKSTSN